MRSRALGDYLRVVFRLLGMLALGLITANAAAQGPARHALDVDLAGARLLGSPQDETFATGFGASLSYAYRPIPAIGIECHFATFLFSLRENDPKNAYGEYHAVGLGVRAYPIQVRLGDLWVAGRTSLVSAGELVRLGLTAGVGFNFRLAWWARLGPALHYVHILNAGAHPLGPGDVGFLQFGVRFSFLGESPPQEQ